MKTQTKPELKEPEIPSNVALSVEDSSIIDVCVQNNTFQQKLVHVYIRDLDRDINALLEGAEYLESRVFEGKKPVELRIRFLGLAGRLKPVIDLKRNDGTYLLEYELSHREQIYNYVRRLE